MCPKNIISQRQLRFAEIIREIISDTLNKNFIINSEIELGSITVSYVKLSKDFILSTHLTLFDICFDKLSNNTLDFLESLAEKLEITG